MPEEGWARFLSYAGAGIGSGLQRAVRGPAEHGEVQDDLSKRAFKGCRAGDRRLSQIGL